MSVGLSSSHSFSYILTTAIPEAVCVLFFWLRFALMLS